MRIKLFNQNDNNDDNDDDNNTKNKIKTTECTIS